MTKEPIPSPFNLGPKVTNEILDNVLKLIPGAKSCFIVVSDEDETHECKGDCQGHYVNINSIGFSSDRVLSIAAMIAENAGMELVLKDDLENNK